MGRSSPVNDRQAQRLSRRPRCPAPTTIAARRVVSGTDPEARTFAVSARLRRWRERFGDWSPRAPRYTSWRRPARSASGQRSRPRLCPAARSRCCPGSERGNRRGRLLSKPLSRTPRRLRRRRAHRTPLFPCEVDARRRRRRPACKQRHECLTHGAGGAEDGDLHRSDLTPEPGEVAPAERDVEPRLNLRVEDAGPAAPSTPRGKTRKNSLIAELTSTASDHSAQT